jgi:hypothetical protein
MNRQSGEVRVGTIVWLLIAAALVMISIEAIPVKMRSSQLQDFMTETAKFASNLSEERLQSKILNHALSLDLPATKKTVSVTKRNGSIRIRASYTIPLEFPFYTYNWEFEHDVERPIFII